MAAAEGRPRPYCSLTGGFGVKMPERNWEWPTTHLWKRPNIMKAFWGWAR